MNIYRYLDLLPHTSKPHDTRSHNLLNILRRQCQSAVAKQAAQVGGGDSRNLFEKD